MRLYELQNACESEISWSKSRNYILVYSQFYKPFVLDPFFKQPLTHSKPSIVLSSVRIMSSLRGPIYS